MPSLPLPHHNPIAVSVRGGFPENIHYGSVAVVDNQGRLLASVGDVTTPMFTRSCLKPIQAMPLIAHAAERYGLKEEDIAFLCSSHSGEAMHVERAASLLSKVGSTEANLACGTHTPFFYGVTGQTPKPGARFTALHHNCSGKHSGMLMLANALGAPMADYLSTGHPVQQHILSCVSHFTGVPVGDMVRGTDGCSAPNYALPLAALAHAFAKLTLTEPDTRYGEAPARIARAMSQHPEWVSGQGRNDLTLMRAGDGDWVSKVGADGVQVLASFSRGVAIAAKCSDGLLTPLMVAFVAVMEQLDWLDEAKRSALSSLLSPALKNSAGIEVGDMRAVFALHFSH